MPCIPFETKHGRGIMCIRGRRTRERCSVPGCGRVATLLCDGKTDAGTCDAHLCRTHGTNIGPEEDLCPDCAARQSPELPLSEPDRWWEIEIPCVAHGRNVFVRVAVGLSSDGLVASAPETLGWARGRPWRDVKLQLRAAGYHGKPARQPEHQGTH